MSRLPYDFQVYGLEIFANGNLRYQIYVSFAEELIKTSSFESVIDQYRDFKGLAPGLL